MTVGATFLVRLIARLFDCVQQRRGFVLCCGTPCENQKCERRKRQRTDLKRSHDRPTFLVTVVTARLQLSTPVRLRARRAIRSCEWGNGAARPDPGADRPRQRESESEYG